jgi:hypothetical protein
MPTKDSDREFLEAKIAAVEKTLCLKITDLEKRMNSDLVTSKEAMKRAEDILKDKFAAVNEMRQMAIDQNANSMSRNEYYAAHKELVNRTENVEKQLAKTSGIAIGISGIAIIITVVEFIRSILIR